MKKALLFACLFAFVTFSSVAIAQKTINLDAAPFTPNGWTVESNQGGGQLEWDASKITLWFSKNQLRGKMIKGTELREELRGKKVLGANVLDFFLAHPELIPESWKGESVYFWGTVYRDQNGNLLVRCLHASETDVWWYANDLNERWNSNDPAAVLLKK
jgi:hypothetical protein